MQHSTSQPTSAITASLSLHALMAIIGSVSLVWLMHYKSSPGLAYPPTVLTDSHLHVAATCSVHAESLSKSTVDTHRLLASWVKIERRTREHWQKERQKDGEKELLSQNKPSSGRITETFLGESVFGWKIV